VRVTGCGVKRVPSLLRRVPKRSWVAVCTRTPMLSDGAKVLCRELADRMDAEGHARIHRADLADALGVTERTVQRRLGELVERGYLHRLLRGQKGVHPLVVATVPERGWSVQGDVQGDTRTDVQGDATGVRECLPDERDADAFRETPGVSHKKYRERSDRLAVDAGAQQRAEHAPKPSPSVTDQEREEGDESAARSVALPAPAPLAAPEPGTAAVRVPNPPNVPEWEALRARFPRKPGQVARR
jgi:DNA-binding transcriptional MocR family regulator